MFAANYLWPARTMVGEQLVIVIHPEAGQMRCAGQIGRGPRRTQPPPAELQACQRLSRLGSRFPAHRVAENQARRTGRANPQKPWAAKRWCRCESSARYLDREVART